MPSPALCLGKWRLTVRLTVDREEVDRLRKRFMKLDKVRFPEMGGRVFIT